MNRMIGCVFLSGTMALAGLFSGCNRSVQWQNATKCATLTGVDKEIQGAFSVPSVLGGQPVNAIGILAFSQCRGLTAVTMPDSVEHIGEYAFVQSDSLASVDVGNGLKRIRDGAFWGCTNLATVTLGSARSIGPKAFAFCASLGAAPIPDGVTDIGEGAFEHCSALTSVLLPDSVATVGKEAFRGCESLSTVTIGAGVTSIGRGAFADCNRLERVSVPGSWKGTWNLWGTGVPETCEIVYRETAGPTGE